MSEFSGDAVPETDVVVSGTELSGAELSGNMRIDEAIARLDSLDELPVEAHPEIFDEIHTNLRNALANAGRDEDLPSPS